MLYSAKGTSEAVSRMDRIPLFVDEGNDCKSPPMKKERVSLSLKRKGRNDEQKNRFAKLSEQWRIQSRAWARPMVMSAITTDSVRKCQLTNCEEERGGNAQIIKFLQG